MINLKNPIIFTKLFTKLYDSTMEETRKKYNLSHVEINIINFLYNNAPFDTARDISEMRQISKGNVSTAVESLIQKKLLTRNCDQKDRRIIHLKLTEEADPIIKEIEINKEYFSTIIFEGFSEEEINSFLNFNERLISNLRKGLKNEG